MNSKTAKKNINRKIRKILGYSIIGIYIVIVMLIFVALKPKEVLVPINLSFIPIPTSLPTPTPTPIPTSTPTPIPTKVPIPTIQKNITLNPTQKPKTPRETLISLAPYTGTNFKMVYNDYKTYSEVLITINSKNSASGDAEFENFLHQNGIPNRSVIGGGFEVEVKPF